MLLLHAWWGLNDTIRRMADRLAESGFTVIAPDLHRGVVATTIEEAERATEDEESRVGERRAITAAAVDRLRGEPGVRPDSIGVIGISFGVWYGMTLAPEAPSVAAVVAIYGMGEGDWSATSAAFQGHFAEDDDFNPIDEVDGLESSLRKAGRRVEFFRYPGVRHWFMEPDRPEYDEGAANLAWGRILGFLRERLD